MQFQIVRHSTEQININYKKENVCVRVCVCLRARLCVRVRVCVPKGYF